MFSVSIIYRCPLKNSGFFFTWNLSNIVKGKNHVIYSLQSLFDDLHFNFMFSSVNLSFFSNLL